MTSVHSKPARQVQGPTASLIGAKIVHVIPEDWFFYSHRRALGAATVAAGADVLVAARFTKHESLLRGEGFRTRSLLLRRGWRSPLKELVAFLDLVRLYRSERPTLIHQTTIKPVIFGSLAAWIACDAAVVNGISGLGHIFSNTGPLAALVRTAVVLAYRVVSRLLGERVMFVFENPTDRARFVALGIVDESRSTVVLGMGCDVERFRPSPIPDGTLVVMFAGRLLWSKGVGDLVEAVSRLRRSGEDVKLVLVGDPDDDNPDGVDRKVLDEWTQSGAAEWWGKSDDMPAVLSRAHLVALPSKYGEGLPKILLEAAASGRALLASRIPGCVEIVLEGDTGYLVAPGSVAEIETAIRSAVHSREKLASMGRRGRAEVLQRFSDSIVTQRTFEIYRSLLRN